MARDVNGVGVALIGKVVNQLLDQIPISNRRCAMRLGTAMKIKKDRVKKRCLFVVSVYALIGYNTDARKDEICCGLFSICKLVAL